MRGKRIVADLGLDQRKIDAEAIINAHFNRLAGEHAQRDAEHMSKRLEAQRLAKKGTAPQAWFAAAAEVEGLTPAALAERVRRQPDAAAERGLDRRRMIVAVRKAATVSAIETVVNAIGRDLSGKPI